MKIITCGRCKRTRPHQAAGLCPGCYSWRRRQADYTPTLVQDRVAARLEDLEFWAEAGITLREAAERLGIRRVGLVRWCLRTKGAEHVLAVLRENEMRWLGR